MRFANLGAGHLIWVVLGVAIFLIWAYKHRKKLLYAFAQQEVLGELTDSFSLKKYKLKVFLFLSALIFLLISLLRPQWGFHWQEVKRTGVDIFIAVDTSKSMLAQDIKPNRLERAKLAIKELIKKLDGDRVGLISFAGTAFIQCPLTLDYSGFLFTLDDLDTQTIPRGGTSLSRAIKQAIDGYEGGAKKYKALIIITDGEDHEGGVMSVVQEAKNQGVKIFCVGIGTEEGELIPLVDDTGAMVFLKDKEGNVVKTRLNEKVLSEIALNTGGAYIRATPLNFGLDFIYDEKIGKMEKKELTSKMAKNYEEKFQIPLFIALILLALDTFVTTYKDEKNR